MSVCLPSCNCMASYHQDFLGKLLIIYFSFIIPKKKRRETFYSFIQCNGTFFFTSFCVQLYARSKKGFFL